MSRHVGLIVFDWAGTLVDCGSSAPVRAFAEVFRNRDVAVSEEEIRLFMGSAKRDHIRSLLELPRVSEAWSARHGAPPTENDVDDIYDRFIPIQQAAAAAATELVPDACAALEALARLGIPYGTTTGYPRAIGGPVIEAARDAGVASIADVCTDEVAAGRPAPDMIRRCMEAAGVEDPARVVKIGDTIVDVETGLRAGSWSIAVTLTGSEVGLDAPALAALSDDERDARHRAAADRLLGAGAHAALATLTGLPELLETIEARLDDGAGPGPLSENATP